jgi:CrcB protein
MQVALIRLLILAGAGSLGAVTRHGIHTVARQVARTHVPMGTLAINVVGAFAIGIVLGWPGGAHSTLRTVLASGFLGEFTTFSSLAYGSVALLRAGRTLDGLLYPLGSLALGSLALGVLAVGLGDLTGAWVRRQTSPPAPPRAGEGSTDLTHNVEESAVR